MFTKMLSLVATASLQLLGAQEVYFVRHTESTGQLAGRLQGQGVDSDRSTEPGQVVFSTRDGRPLIDSPVLSEQGKRQAAELAQKVQAVVKEGVVLLSSDLLRCRETTDIIAAHLWEAKIDVIVVLDARLREADHGNVSGLTKDQYNETPDYKNHKALSPENRFNSAIDPIHGESLEQVAKRAKAAIFACMQQYPNRTIIVVTHGGPMNALAREATGNYEADVKKQGEIVQISLNQVIKNAL